MAQHFKYVVVGAGLAGTSAIESIREHDRDGSLLLIGEEEHLPYDRPPLSKKLWWGKKRVEDIFLKPADYYAQQSVELRLGRRAVRLDAGTRIVTDARGDQYGFDKLLLATGGKPRRLAIPGGEMEDICYYRTLDDYLAIHALAEPGRSVIIVGGGFIGSELAASLRSNDLDVTMIFPGAHLVDKVFPDYLAKALTTRFMERGIRIERDRPASFTKNGNRFVVTTGKGARHEADMVIVGVGITPDIALAEQANLALDDGIVVDDYLATSHPDIFAAGDIARYRSVLLGRSKRSEHWDNAMNQGRCAGANMSGARMRYDYEPYFFSDLFEFGYEAVGETDARLATFADWQKENETGVIYYLRDDRVRGVMLCNVWEKVDEARALICSGEAVTSQMLRGRIR